MTLGLACDPRVEVDIGRLLAHCVFRCSCVLTIDMLTGDRIALGVHCPDHVAMCVFADPEK